jgi:hypothetical protein
MRVSLVAGVLLAFLAVMLLGLAGCGAGGYPGGGIEALSGAFTIDAGQSYPIKATAEGDSIVSWTMACGAAPSCGSLSASSGPSVIFTAPSGLTAQMTTTLTALVAGTNSSKTVVITINPDPTLGNPPNTGEVGTAYTGNTYPTGGTAPLKLSLTAGALPAGLSFNTSTGLISGTPTASGTFPYTVQLVDSSAVPFTVTEQETIVVETAGAAPVMLTGNPPAGAVGTPYSTAFTATGGTTPYTFTQLSGALPPGLTLSPAGVLSGTPTAIGVSVFTVQVADEVGTKVSASFSVTITAAPPTLTLTGPPAGTVGVVYSGTIGVGGGSAYSCTITAGTLQAGLTLTGCTVSGTPTVASTVNLTVKATDASNPQETTTGPVSLTIVPAPLSLTLSSLPSGTINVPYSATIGVSGGTAPYSCTITSGTLQAGLTLTGCTVSGTPTVASTVNLTVKATDSSPTQETTTGPVSLTIKPAALSLTLTSLPNGTINVPYSATIGVSGGTAPYSCTITSGTLQAGLTLTGCTVSGTPTVASTVQLTVKATDSSNPQETVTGPVSLTINPAPLTLTLTSLPSGTINVPYSATIGVSGGTAPYSCTITSGTLQAGLTLTGCTVSGTPTVASTVNLTVKATDSSPTQETTTGPVSLTINPAPLTLTLTSLPSGTVNVPYSATIGVSGGTAPYSCTITAGTLQAGLTLSGCTVSGTPTVASTVHLTVKATDSSPTQETTSGPVSLTINPAAASIVITSPPAGTVNVPYSGPIGITGGTGPYTCTITSGTLPAGLSLSGCTIVGTPTAPGSTPVTVKVTDSGNPPATATGPITIVINPAPLALTLTSLPNGTINVPYSATIGVSGGTAPYSCTITSGTLQAGLTLTGCTVSGTPTVASTVHLTVKATDSSNPQETVTGPVSLTINPAPLTLTLTSLPNGTINVPYSATIGVSGGTAPYSCTITSGTLQAGLTLTGCTVSGTPTVASTVQLTVKATDSSNPQETVTGPVSLTINPAPLTLTLSSLPNGTINVPYSATIGVSGGTAPYSCTITSGTLQAGLTLTGCTVSGTPTVASTVQLTVKATDSSNPQETTSGPVSLTINPAPLTLTLSSLPNGTVNVPYSATIGVSGGTSPYSCTITAGTLQAGLTLTGCTVSGTPTVASTVQLTVKATDSSNPQETVTGPVSLTINPAPLTLTLTSLPDGTINTPYSAVIGVSGGTAPYSCTITSGTLQAGLTLTGCTVSGTPTVASTVQLTVKATDASNPQETVTGPVSLTIKPAALTLTLSSLPDGTVGVAYDSTIGVAGGTAPYSCTITSGTLQAGLTLTGCTVSGTPTVASTVQLTVKATDSSNPQETVTGPVSLTINPAPVSIVITSPPAGTVNVPYSGPIGITGGTGPYTCSITTGTLIGTPSAPGSTPITVKVTDSSNPKNTSTGPITIVINPATATLTLSSPPVATVDTPYTGTIGVSGGTSPYTCHLNSGTVPPGLTLTNCTLTGTPTTAGPYILNITATDSSTPTAGTVTGNVTVTVNPLAPLTLTGSLPNATVGVPYTQTITAQGGLAPYTYAITAGTLPPGITLDPNTGVFSGTPTAPGASSFTLTATDSEGPAKTASLPLVLLVVYPTTPNDGELDGPYTYLFQGYDDVVAGVLAYRTATVASFTADGTGVVSAGELDANHQSSDPTGNTVATQNFLGTYTLGTDNRGSLTITVLNPDGTTGLTTTYAISVKAPVAPATITTEGSLIESDDDQVVGTKGSGSLFAQTPAAFTAGLAGSYAFGVSGDTPCLPSCTIGIIAGPVATVGQFTTDSAGAITSGTSDTNIASTNIPNSTLGGTYTMADTNGRLQLTLSTGGTAGDAYPTDFAVYLIDANRAFILSRDKHSAYILLAGSAQLQTQSSFSNASMDAPFIGYENTQTNPGLVGATLQNVLNFSTATIFRGTGSGNGNCSITNVDTGGVTGLLNGLTGILGNITGLSSILGGADYTGATTCATTNNGRGVLQYPSGGLTGILFPPPSARVYYLSSPETGYFLETSYAGLGKFEAQTGAPFSEANTFTGTYVYGSTPASSLASIDSSGYIVSNGHGSATSTLDLNVGVGTVNVIELGQTSTQTYTAPNSTTGRFTLGPAGTDVIYAITPNRFVLLDTDPLTTSPSVAVLY